VAARRVAARVAGELAAIGTGRELTKLAFKLGYTVTDSADSERASGRSDRRPAARPARSNPTP
jgi:hypothetical protein